MMDFDYDVIISHSKTDNLGQNEKNGWTDNLKYFLEIFLQQLLGRDPKIVTSGQIARGEVSTEHVYASSIALMSIVSPEYCDSENCHQELRNFINASETNLGLFYSENSRIFKVSKSDVSASLMPSALHGLFSYDFFDIDAATKEISQLQIFNSESDRKYWLKLIDLAYDLYKLIDAVENDGGKKSFKGNKKIYLAETSFDQKGYRDIIKRELERHGHKVFPDKPLSRDAKEFEDAVFEDLSSCDMSIHIIGENYGELLSDKDVSIVEEQNNIAANYSIRFENSKESFPRLIWISPDLKLFNEKQQIFIEELKQNKEVLMGAEIVQTPLEFLKTIIRNKLSQLDKESESNRDRSSIDNSLKQVYLVSESKFKNETADVKQYIEQKGFGVVEINYEEGHRDIIASHRKHLADCDAALIYYAENNQQWMKMKLIDLLKAPGFGRKKPMSGKAVLSKIKDPLLGINIGVNDLTIIESPGSISPNALDSFLEKIK